MDFDLDFEKGYLVFFEVVNLGNSLALDVSIEIEPPLESSIDVEIGELKMLKEGITTLPPGKRLRTLFDMSFRRNESAKDFAMNHLATVRYTDESGKRKFEETYNLDLDQYMNMQFVTTRVLNDIHDEIKKLRSVLEKWSWSGGRGMITMNPEEARVENERLMSAMEERRRRMEESDVGVDNPSDS